MTQVVTITAVASTIGGRRRWLLRLTSVLIGVTVLAAVLELTFWILPLREESPRVLPSGSNRVARFRPNESWRFSAGWDFFIVNEVRTNNTGWVSEINYVPEADTPLVAFIGDSYVEGDHLPWAETCHGSLAHRLERELRVYSFGMNAAPLSQYLAYAEHVQKIYRPAALVIPIIENDFDESLRQFQPTRRHHVFFGFEDRPDGRLRLVPPSAPPAVAPTSPLSRFRLWVNEQSGLLRYRYYHVRNTQSRIYDEQRRNDPNAAGTPEVPFRGTDPATAHSDLVTTSRRAVDAFLRMLPERSGLAPAQIVFVADGIRPYRYTEGWDHRWDGSYHDVLRRYFMDEAEADGYEVIDMQPVFVDHFGAHRQPFNWPRDLHWNALGHRLCAEQVVRSPVLQSLWAGTSATETE